MSPAIRNKKEKFQLSPKYWLLIVSVLCIAIMILNYTTTLISTPLYSFAGYVVVPLENGISVVGSYFDSKSKLLTKVNTLIEENEALQEQVDDLVTENTNLQQERYELNRLRELYAIDAEYSDYEKTGARVIAKDSGNFYHSFVINKGENDGLKVDMNVVSGGGLVGRITKVGPNWARVISIIDDDSNVSAEVLSTSDTMIVTGNLELYQNGKIEFSKLNDSDGLVQEGDKVVTSNISDKYLPGILIGYISSLKTDSNNLTKSGTITPAVDFAHIDTVLVILKTKQEIPDEALTDDSTS